MNEFYITSHAVEQFQTRIALLPPQEVRQEILSNFLPWECKLLGYVRWNGHVGPVFRGKYDDKEYLILMQTDIENKHRGILIPTIVLADAIKTMKWERNPDKGKAKWLAELKDMPA
jgi:hypothetical protein